MNKITLTYHFGEHEWEIVKEITEEDIEQYFQMHFISVKKLFRYLDFERLGKDEFFMSFLLEKYREDAKEECEQYYE